VKRLATGASSFSTFFQVAPHLLKVMRHMRPTWHLAALASVDETFVRTHGIRGLIWDVDGTLTGDRRPALENASASPFRALTALPALKHVVLSNASEERYLELGTIFPMMPILRAYTQGGEVLYRRRQGTDDTWSAAELARRLAAGARVIRKPNAALVDYAVKELGCAKEDVVMIGDQYLTDVAGANLGGVRSIKLPTLAHESFRASVRFSQNLERLLYALLYGPAEMAG